MFARRLNSICECVAIATRVGAYIIICQIQIDIDYERMAHNT